MKLTKAQKSVLNDVQAYGRFVCIDTYSPALRLIDLGLVNHRRLSFGSLELTPKEDG